VIWVTNTFLVPVRAREDGTLALLTGRLRTGERVGVRHVRIDPQAASSLLGN
jgi:hypothetical protein